MRRRCFPLALAIGAMLVAAAASGKGSMESLAPQQRDIATLAIDTLAADLGIAKDRITLDTVRAVDWPDSSVGCPQPGRAYLDVITPGHKVTLRVGREVHVVHEANGRAIVCHRTKPYAGINPQRELVFGPQMIAARKDLASRLGVPEAEIQPESAAETTWDNAGLGCPDPGAAYPPGKVTGWVMTLRHEGRDYTYHTDMLRTIPCPAISTE